MAPLEIWQTPEIKKSRKFILSTLNVGVFELQIRELHFQLLTPFSKKLDETTAELKKTSIALEAEKKKTEDLLNEMLPRKVAEQLREGKRVDAG